MTRKIKIVTIFSFTCSLLIAQINSTYINSNNSVAFNFDSDSLFIYRLYDSDNGYESENSAIYNVLFSFKLETKGDSIFVVNDSIDACFFRLDNYKLRLEGGIPNLVQHCEILYCIKRYNNGKISFIGNWKNGEMDGNWIFWDDNHNQNIIFYQNGRIK